MKFARDAAAATAAADAATAATKAQAIEDLKQLTSNCRKVPFLDPKATQDDYNDYFDKLGSNETRIFKWYEEMFGVRLKMPNPN